MYSYVQTIVQMSKKRLNIPVCDVAIDTDYDKLIPPNFKLATEFVRHTKKIGDEADISIDYILEDEDLVWINGNTRLTADKEAMKMLSITAFENIIDILEKHTGLAHDPIPLVIVYFVTHTICVFNRMCGLRRYTQTRSLPSDSAGHRT
jgi:hypothetical protein